MPHGPSAALLFLIVNLDIFKWGYFLSMRISFLQCEYSYPVVRISWIRRASAECPQSSCLIIFTFLRLEIDLTGSNEGTIILLQAVKVFVISCSDNVLWQCDLTQCNAGRCHKAESTRVTAQLHKGTEQLGDNWMEGWVRLQFQKCRTKSWVCGRRYAQQASILKTCFGFLAA